MAARRSHRDRQAAGGRAGHRPAGPRFPGPAGVAPRVGVTPAKRRNDATECDHSRQIFPKCRPLSSWRKASAMPSSAKLVDHRPDARNLQRPHIVLLLGAVADDEPMQPRLLAHQQRRWAPRRSARSARRSARCGRPPAPPRSTAAACRGRRLRPRDQRPVRPSSPSPARPSPAWSGS